MPHFNRDVAEITNLIPKNKLLIIDKAVETLKGDYAAVFQDFENDVYKALSSGLDLLKNYGKLTLIMSKDRFQFIPDVIIKSFKKFGKTHGITCKTADKLTPDFLKKEKLKCCLQTETWFLYKTYKYPGPEAGQ